MPPGLDIWIEILLEVVNNLWFFADLLVWYVNFKGDFDMSTLDLLGLQVFIGLSGLKRCDCCLHNDNLIALPPGWIIVIRLMLSCVLPRLNLLLLCVFWAAPISGFLGTNNCIYFSFPVLTGSIFCADFRLGRISWDHASIANHENNSSGSYCGCLLGQSVFIDFILGWLLDDIGCELCGDLWLIVIF